MWSHWPMQQDVGAAPDDLVSPRTLNEGERDDWHIEFRPQLCPFQVCQILGQSQHTFPTVSQPVKLICISRNILGLNVPIYVKIYYI